MKKETFNTKINVYGSQKEIDDAITELNNTHLVNVESTDRLIIMDMMDNKNIKASILYNGNTVWSKKRILRDIKKALNSKTSKISEYGHGDYDRIFYDSHEGKYYDRHTDLYLRQEELKKYGLGA